MILELQQLIFQLVWTLLYVSLLRCDVMVQTLPLKFKFHLLKSLFHSIFCSFFLWEQHIHFHKRVCITRSWLWFGNLRIPHGDLFMCQFRIRTRDNSIRHLWRSTRPPTSYFIYILWPEACCWCIFKQSMMAVFFLCLQHLVSENNYTSVYHIKKICYYLMYIF